MMHFNDAEISMEFDAFFRWESAQMHDVRALAFSAGLKYQ